MCARVRVCVCARMCVHMFVCMNNRIHSTLFKTKEENQTEEAKKGITKHTQTKQGHVTLIKY